MNATTFSEAKTHGVNEDTLKSVPHPADGSLRIVALADGQGGRAGGAEASRTAVTTALQIALPTRPRKLRSWRFWTKLLQEVDQAVSDEPEGGFTTFVAAAVSKAAIDGVSSGDSAAILVGPQGEAVVLTANQKKNPPVGSQMCVPTTFRARLEAESKVLVMSDGVYKFVSSEEIYATVTELNATDAIRALRDSAAASGAALYDDFSLAVISSSEQHSG